MIEDVLLNRCENSTERMLEYAGTLDPKCKPTDVKKKGAAPGAKATGGKEKSWRDEPVEKRLTHALVKGIDEFAVRVSLLACTSPACTGTGCQQSSGKPATVHTLCSHCCESRRTTSRRPR